MPAPTITLGLTSAEASAARAAAGPPARVRTGRTYLQIVWSNTVTIFNLVLGTLLVLTLVFGDPRDALFGGVIVANTLDRDRPGDPRETHARSAGAARRAPGAGMAGR